jgi:ATP-dependent helicase YprA (DUF1998 family)
LPLGLLPRLLVPDPMSSRRPTSDRLDDLLEQREQLDARIDALSARARVEAKKDEDRLKWLLGTLAFDKLASDADLQAFVRRELPPRLTDRDQRRGLWQKLFPDADP